MGTGKLSGNGHAGRGFDSLPGPARLFPPILTPRENQLVGFLARDTQAKEIAAQLGTSVCTVRNQINALYKKLDVHSRMGALIALGCLPQTTPFPKPTRSNPGLREGGG